MRLESETLVTLEDRVETSQSDRLVIEGMLHLHAIARRWREVGSLLSPFTFWKSRFSQVAHVELPKSHAGRSVCHVMSRVDEETMMARSREERPSNCQSKTKIGREVEALLKTLTTHYFPSESGFIESTTCIVVG